MPHTLYTLYTPTQTDIIPENFTGIVVNANGSKYSMLNGKLHCIEGPAIDQYNGVKHWYLNGEKVSKTEHAEYCLEQRKKICFPSQYMK